MESARRVHLFCAAGLFLSVSLWLRVALALPPVDAETNRLLQVQAGLVDGSISADNAPVLARLMIQDDRFELTRRLSWLPAVVDSRLQDAVHILARAEEDPQALLALVLNPELEIQAISLCPHLPEGVAVVCESDAWSSLRTQILEEFGKVIATKPAYAAAGRVGGNDVSLTAADHLCRMGLRGRDLALNLVDEKNNNATQVLGLLGLGCSGGREGLGSVLQERVSRSGAVGIAATLECAVASDCVVSSETPNDSGSRRAVEAYALQLQESQ
jgi:hypothetical protein